MVFRSFAAPALLLSTIPAVIAGFVTTSNGQFRVNGSEFRFLGTTAYWLSTLTNDQDIYNTLANMSANGIKVVRTWAFNDVTEIPTDNSTWFQYIAPNGTVFINEGPNGLPRLDAIVSAAEKLGLYIHFSLTNNWNPLPDATTPTRARNSLSNDYGGMDTYVRAHADVDSQTHDLFYTNDKIYASFEKYTTKIVSRYKRSPAIFAWEVANDPRCNSTIAATEDCTAHTVTRWHSKVAKHIKKVDPNHLISSGSHGFFCVDCPKLFPRRTGAPAARPSTRSAPGFAKRKALPLTRARLISEKKKAFRVASESSRSGMSGLSIRGRWSAPVSRAKSDLDLGDAFNGVFGVDSEDILNIPDIGFGTFQLFPDQNSYDSATISTDAFNRTVEQGINWIQRNGEAGQLFGKPMALTGFGLVTQGNAASFVPFNSSTPLLSTGSFDNSTVPTTSTVNITTSTVSIVVPTSTVSAVITTSTDSAVDTTSTVSTVITTSTDSAIDVTSTVSVVVTTSTESTSIVATTASTSSITIPSSSPSTNTTTARYGVTDDQRNEAYGKWVNATIQYGVQGAIQYQWGQSNLTPSSDSPIVSNQDQSGTTGNTDETGISPNDGYSQEVGTSSSQSFFDTASQEIGSASVV